MFDLLLCNATAVTPNGLQFVDIAVKAGRIVELGDFSTRSAAIKLNLRGLHILPGVIDSQVHFREPGLTHKEDLHTGTKAAVLGGVTAIFEMPNTHPATTTATALEDKLQRAKGRAFCDYAFFVGGTPQPDSDWATLERLPGCAGIKVFMGSSTGDLLVSEDKALDALLRRGRRRVAIHAEDEARLRERKPLAEAAAHPRFHSEWRDAESARLATERVLKLARRQGRLIHVLHVTTAEEMALLAEFREIATVEVTPQHLTLVAPECYEKLGTLAQMNPPIRTENHRQALWAAVNQGLVDVIGSDHAPHTLDEKAKPYPHSPSGMPGVQTLVPLLLNHVNEGRLSLERLVDLTSAGPARVYGVAYKGRIAVGYDADFTIVDLRKRLQLENQHMASKCGWTPFDGMTVMGAPTHTILRGQIVMQDNALVTEPLGIPVSFLDTLSPEQFN